MIVKSGLRDQKRKKKMGGEPASASSMIAKLGLMKGIDTEEQEPGRK